MMDVPQSVQSYYEARLWIAIHWGIPCLGFLFAYWLVVRVWEYFRDVHTEKAADFGNGLSLTQNKEDEKS